MVLFFSFAAVADACRIGEATNPGPCSQTVVTMGTVNTAGLSRRVPLVLGLDCGLWALTETQLSESGIKSFKKELQFHAQGEGRNLRFSHGHAAPPRQLSSEAGTWTGVATVSDFPLQQRFVEWKGAEYLSGRLMFTSCQLPGVEVAGAVVYGAAQSPTWKKPLQLTASLLDTVTEELVLGRGGHVMWLVTSIAPSCSFLKFKNGTIEVGGSCSNLPGKNFSNPCNGRAKKLLPGTSSGLLRSFLRFLLKWRFSISFFLIIQLSRANLLFLLLQVSVGAGGCLHLFLGKTSRLSNGIMQCNKTMRLLHGGKISPNPFERGARESKIH